MKKILLLAVMAVASISLAVAQPRAIGGRLGYGVEFSYEHGFGESNKLSLDAGFPGLFMNGIGVEGVVTYDWINPFGADFSKVWDKKGEWNWYMGVGAGVGGFLNRVVPAAIAGKEYGAYWNNSAFVGAAGRIGVEYNFWFPLQLAIDWRPVIGPSFNGYREYDPAEDKFVRKANVKFNMAGLYMGGVALSVRYRFH